MIEKTQYKIWEMSFVTSLIFLIFVMNTEACQFSILDNPGVISAIRARNLLPSINSYLEEMKSDGFNPSKKLIHCFERFHNTLKNLKGEKEPSVLSLGELLPKLSFTEVSLWSRPVEFIQRVEQTQQLLTNFQENHEETQSPSLRSLRQLARFFPSGNVLNLRKLSLKEFEATFVTQLLPKDLDSAVATAENLLNEYKKLKIRIRAFRDLLETSGSAYKEDAVLDLGAPGPVQDPVKVLWQKEKDKILESLRKEGYSLKIFGDDVKMSTREEDRRTVKHIEKELSKLDMGLNFLNPIIDELKRRCLLPQE